MNEYTDCNSTTKERKPNKIWSASKSSFNQYWLMSNIAFETRISLAWLLYIIPGIEDRIAKSASRMDLFFLFSRELNLTWQNLGKMGVNKSTRKRRKETFIKSQKLSK